jgi:hypothetical protein
VVVPVPVLVIPPGFLVSVQVPDPGKPLKPIEPVATEQVGCVTELIVGVDGAELTVAITPVLGEEVHEPSVAETQ